MPEQERQAETEQDEHEATVEQPLAEASITDDQSEEADTATVADEEDTTAYDDIGEVEGEAEMRDMIGYIARVLVDDTDAVEVRSGWSDGRININLKVADEDKGKVIGRRGRVVHAMQSLLRVAATKSNTRAGIDVE